MRCLYKQPKYRTGVTRTSVDAVDRWVEKGFSPTSIRLKGTEKGPVCYLRGTFQGASAYLKLTGVNWGYHGEGPRGLAHILKLIGEISEKAFSYDIAEGNDYFSKKPFSITIRGVA